MTGRHRGGRYSTWRLTVAVLAIIVRQGYRGRRRPVPVLPELVRQPPSVTAASAHLSLVSVRGGQEPLVDTVPHPVIRLFPLPVADPLPVPDDVLPYRSKHSA